jgi:hypothetical protein
MRTKPKPWTLETPHREGCHAIAGGAPFQTLADEPTVFRNWAGNSAKIGCNYLYFRVRCNDMQCPATAVVHLDTALVAVGLNDER